MPYATQTWARQHARYGRCSTDQRQEGGAGVLGWQKRQHGRALKDQNITTSPPDIKSTSTGVRLHFSRRSTLDRCWKTDDRHVQARLDRELKSQPSTRKLLIKSGWKMTTFTEEAIHCDAHKF